MFLGRVLGLGGLEEVVGVEVPLADVEEGVGVAEEEGGLDDGAGGNDLWRSFSRARVLAWKREPDCV